MVKPTLLIAFLLLGQSFSLRAESAKLTVLTTTLPIFSLTASVAGKYAEVENLVPPGIEPHDYQISSRELRKIRQAALILINGLRLEDWLDRYLKSKDTQAKVVTVSRGLDSEVIFGVTPLLGTTARPDSRFPNPHFWLDPVLARRALTNILAALQAADPPHAAVFAENAAQLSHQLDDLNSDYDREMGLLRDKPFVTSHDFFAYLARRYRLKLAGVVESDPEVEPSLRYVIELTALIRRERVAVIFVEPRFSSKIVDQLCHDLGIVSRELDPIETGPLTPGAYVEGMRRNLSTLKEALGGKRK